MGMMMSTIQLKNQQRLSRDAIEKKIRAYLQNKGWSSTAKKSDAINYSIVFSEGDWITLTSTVYTFETAFEEQAVQELARLFKTSCIQTTIYDSEVLFLVLVDGEMEQIDRVAVGKVFEEDMAGSEYTIASGNPNCWKGLLVNGATWERLLDTWEKPYTFVEDALFGTAQLLGMDAKNTMVDYSYWEEVAGNDPAVTTDYYVLQNRSMKNSLFKFNLNDYCEIKELFQKSH